MMYRRSLLLVDAYQPDFADVSVATAVAGESSGYDRIFLYPALALLACLVFWFCYTFRSIIWPFVADMPTIVHGRDVDASITYEMRIRGNEQTLASVHFAETAIPANLAQENEFEQAVLHAIADFDNHAAGDSTIVEIGHSSSTSEDEYLTSEE